MDASSDESGEVRHVNEQDGASCIGDVAHAGEIEEARIGAASPDDHFGLFADRDLLEKIVVDGLRVFSYAIGDDAVKLAREVELVAVREVAAHGEVEAEDCVSGL